MTLHLRAEISLGSFRAGQTLIFSTRDSLILTILPAWCSSPNAEIHIQKTFIIPKRPREPLFTHVLYLSGLHSASPRGSEMADCMNRNWGNFLIRSSKLSSEYLPNIKFFVRIHVLQVSDIKHEKFFFFPSSVSRSFKMQDHGDWEDLFLNQLLF